MLVNQTIIVFSLEIIIFNTINLDFSEAFDTITINLFFFRGTSHEVLLRKPDHLGFRGGELLTGLSHIFRMENNYHTNYLICITEMFMSARVNFLGYGLTINLIL